MKERYESFPPCPPPVVTGPFMDQFIPLTSLEQMSSTEYDVLVVGTGGGGGAAIWRLCQQLKGTGKKIGVVEAGPIMLQTHSYNLPTVAQNFSNYYYNPKITKPIGLTMPDLRDSRQAIALGGKTLFWDMVTPRMPPSQIAETPVPYNEMQTYYNIAEQIMKVNKPDAYDSPLSRILLNRFWENGVPEAEITPRAINFEPVNYGGVNPTVYFSSISFLAGGLEARPFDLAVQARAVQLLGDHGRIAGVKVMTPDKKPYILRAKNIILSAGIFETVRLLLYSGVQGRALGHYLIGHSYMIFSTVINRRDLPATLGPLYLLIPQTADRPYQMQIYRRQNEMLEQKGELGIGFSGYGKVESRYENRLYLHPHLKDEYGVPLLQADFSFSEKDRAIMARMAQDIHQYAAAIGGRVAPPDPCLHTLDHVAGVCRMGIDPANSGTDPYGQIHGVPGLYVADASVLPPYGAVNPTLTIAALAIRTADHIAGQM
ncbi:GMC oxidoreductase [Paenibacillus sp. LHD-38]|uniref:GMC oxidoreductase n=1 Tax=Paenibacillus sp. LHD-38 TaxID=3072143 RepID=UPI00280E6712|nr:GMC oxidoreductase [Paenibacillus sp. LHD-38]MDQ8737117.1 GMC oxidoreductase [Paenibacillus sp. LHD-38]